MWQNPDSVSCPYLSVLVVRRFFMMILSQTHHVAAFLLQEELLEYMLVQIKVLTSGGRLEILVHLHGFGPINRKSRLKINFYF